MGESSDGAPQSPPVVPPRRAPAPISWSPGRGSRERGPLKLLKTLRGRGVLLWAGGEVAAAYDLDLYRRGATHTASGRLEGDLAGLAPADAAAEEASPALRLRLDSGEELDIELVALEPAFAEFEVAGESVGAALSLAAPGR